MEIFKLKTDLTQLDDVLKRLADSLKSAQCKCAIRPGPFEKGARAFSIASRIYAQLWYEDNQVDGRETPIAIGAIEASEESLAIAMEVNALKAQLSAQFAALRDEIGSNLSAAGRDKAFRRYLSEIGLARLSMKLVNRTIPVLWQRPQSIRFSYSSRGKSITRMTPSEALRLLDSSGMIGAHIEVQRRRLMALDDSIFLARVQYLSPYYKANIVFPPKTPKTLPVFMPILYPQGNAETVVSDVLPGEARSIDSRKDKRLSSEPYIPSLRLYLYEN